MAQPTSTPKIEELRFRLKTDPKNRLFYLLAEELRRIGQFPEAEQVIRSGLTHHPTYLSAWVSLGRVLRDQKNERGAVEALSKALQLDPGNVVAARLLADAWLALGEKVEAIKKYKLVQALLPPDEQLAEVVERLERELKAEAEASAEVPAAVAAPEEAPTPVGDVVPEPEVERAAPPSPPVEAPEENPWAAAESEPAASTLEPEPAGSADAPPADVWSASASPAEPAPSAGIESLWEQADSAFVAAEHNLELEDESGVATADAEPMLAAHDSSPFEEAAPDYTSAAFNIEAPAGMSIEQAPLGSELATSLTDELPEEAFAAPAQPEREAEPADVFEPSATAVAEAGDAGDYANTLTMADIYTRQGLVADAQHIYENILLRDPANEVVRGRLAALAPQAAASGRDPRVVRLESWLAKVGRREVRRVQ